MAYCNEKHIKTKLTYSAIPLFRIPCFLESHIREAKNLFTEEVRKTSNVSGKNNKQQLDLKIIEYIKTLIFERWSLAQAEKLEMEWGECKRAIDEGNQRLNRNPALKKSN